MSQVAPESMTESPGAMTPTSQHAADPLPFEHPPKLKGRQRILQSLQRISSTPSLAKLGRASPSNYRTGNKASMSCVSLTSPTFSQGHSYGHSYSSQSSAGFSTAPTSVAGTPCTDSFIHDSRVRVRLVNGNDSTGYFPQGLTSVPLPEEVRTASKDAQISYPSALMAEQMISIPRAIVKVKQLRKRANFDFWDEMPHEIKVQILSFLSPKHIVRCSIVSKAWHKMCFDGQLWMKINTETFYRQISSASLVKLLKAGGPFIKDLNLRGCVQMEKKWKFEGQRLSNLCQNLENLSLEGCRIDESTIHFFLLRNSRLVHINVSGLLEINNSTMEIIARCCPQLQHLNVSWCRKVTTSGLHKVVQSCPKLTDLRAGEIKGFDDPIFLLSLFETNRLERLVVCRCDDLDDESLKLLIQGRDPEIDPLTDRPMVPPRALRHIDFSRCDSLTDIGIQSLAHNVPHLCGLQLTLLAVTDASLTTLLPTIPNLTHLDLEELEDLTNVTLQNLATSPCALRLQHLNASYCESFSDTGMLPLIKACPSLHSLIMDNTRISDLSLVEAAAQLRLRDRACPTLPPAAQKPEITLTLVAYDCANVTWTGVREILSRNAEPHRRSIISLKCFYGYQDTVNEHTKRVLKGDCRAAERLERKWGDYMVASEEAGATGAGARRRRRRARDAAMVHADEEEGGPRGGRRRARSGGCAVM